MVVVPTAWYNGRVWCYLSLTTPAAPPDEPAGWPPRPPRIGFELVESRGVAFLQPQPQESIVSDHNGCRRLDDYAGCVGGRGSTIACFVISCRRQPTHLGSNHCPLGLWPEAFRFSQIPG